MTPPTFVTVLRREPQTGLSAYGENVDVVAAPVQLSPHGAPDPIRQSAYTGVGRAPGEDIATVPVALHTNIPAIQSVMEDNPIGRKVRAQFLHLMRNGGGGQLPFSTRPNIERPPSQPYGSLATVPGYDFPARPSVNANGLSY